MKSQPKPPRPNILKLNQAEANKIMGEMPAGYQLVRYQVLRNLQLEYLKDQQATPFYFPGSFQIHNSKVNQCMKTLSRNQKNKQKNPHRLSREPLLTDQFVNQRISKNQIIKMTENIKKDKRVLLIKDKTMKEIFTKEIQILAYPYLQIITTFDLKCYLQAAFDTYFYSNNETDTLNNKIKALANEVLEEINLFQGCSQRKSVSFIDLDNDKSVSRSQKESFCEQRAVIDLSNAKFQPNLPTLARKINLGYNFKKLKSQQLSVICPKYFYLKQEVIDYAKSHYSIELESLSMREFLEIEKEVKQYLKMRNQVYDVLQRSKKRLLIQEDGD